VRAASDLAGSREIRQRMRRGAWSAPRVDVDVVGKIMPSRTVTGLAEAAGTSVARVPGLPSATDPD
jgi:hypothetical protein